MFHASHFFLLWSKTTDEEINWTYPEVCISLSEILEAFPSEAGKRFSNSLVLKFSHHMKCQKCTKYQYMYM